MQCPMPADEYDGGDSGQIEDIDARQGDVFVPIPVGEITLARVSWRIIENAARTMSLAEAVET